jgi:hypothetical protein
MCCQNPHPLSQAHNLVQTTKVQTVV